MRINRTALKMIVSASLKVNKEACYADSCDKKIGVPYVENAAPAQVVDIYYAPKALRKNIVLIDIHGGFYVGGDRRNNRPFASSFLKEGFDVVLLEYRLNDGQIDVSDELSDQRLVVIRHLIILHRIDIDDDIQFICLGKSHG